MRRPPSCLSASRAQVTTLGNELSQLLLPGMSGVWLSQNVPDSIWSNRDFLNSAAENSPLRLPSSRPTPNSV